MKSYSPRSLRTVTTVALAIMLIASAPVNATSPIQSDSHSVTTPFDRSFGGPEQIAFVYAGESVVTICASGCTYSSTDSTTCHFITAKSLNRLINGFNAAQLNTLTFYLNESTNNCTSALQIVDMPATTQFQDIQIPITSGTGFSFKLQGNTSGTIFITYN